MHLCCTWWHKRPTYLRSAVPQSTATTPLSLCAEADIRRGRPALDPYLAGTVIRGTSRSFPDAALGALLTVVVSHNRPEIRRGTLGPASTAPAMTEEHPDFFFRSRFVTGMALSVGLCLAASPRSGLAREIGAHPTDWEHAGRGRTDGGAGASRSACFLKMQWHGVRSKVCVPVLRTCSASKGMRQQMSFHNQDFGSDQRSLYPLGFVRAAGEVNQMCARVF